MLAYPNKTKPSELFKKSRNAAQRSDDEDSKAASGLVTGITDACKTVLWSARHVTTNTVEGFFGLVRRGVFGTYHHWGRGYLQQYLNEFDFRYNHRKMSDSDRTMFALRATEGKRLTLREPRRASA